jgi:hypothetical protein
MPDNPSINSISSSYPATANTCSKSSKRDWPRWAIVAARGTLNACVHYASVPAMADTSASIAMARPSSTRAKSARRNVPTGSSSSTATTTRCRALEQQVFDHGDRAPLPHPCLQPPRCKVFGYPPVVETDPAVGGTIEDRTIKPGRSSLVGAAARNWGQVVSLADRQVSYGTGPLAVPANCSVPPRQIPSPVTGEVQMR